ncbi:hypothetical protein NIES73_05730 [Sphaerospermopsis kisseleviana NIES-73]|nr:hypothetical protein NIES73_05730 [Sphaerospermopsis kisseleviana NIES-73]
MISCYTAKLYNPNILNSCGTGILPVKLIQVKYTTAYLLNSRNVTYHSLFINMGEKRFSSCYVSIFKICV